jgi:hypothetical protein
LIAYAFNETSLVFNTAAERASKRYDYARRTLIHSNDDDALFRLLPTTRAILRH